jgi:GNAT superfamily N-acetyltransferase
MTILLLVVSAYSFNQDIFIFFLVQGMLKQFSDTHAEIACLAVHPKYRREGRGEILLAVIFFSFTNILNCLLFTLNNILVLRKKSSIDGFNPRFCSKYSHNAVV